MKRKLRYRGVVYEQDFKPTNNTQEPIGKYQGADCRSQNLSTLVARQLPIILRYRGILYVIGDLSTDKGFLKF